MELPLFPIGEIVLLPGMALPLHVFEPRYRELLGRVRTSGEAFGIPCVLPGEELPANLKTIQDMGSRLARVGTLAHLTHVDYLPDGTANIVVVGGERFEILSIDHEKYPYAVAEARITPLEPSDPQWVQAVAKEVLDRFLVKIRPRFGDVSDDVPEDLLLRASFVAANLKLRGDEGQRVLESKTLLERFEILSEYVGVEQRQLN
jgi:Lon protease-like protein